MMNREEIFYKKLTEEYDTFMEEIRDWYLEKVVENSEYIADYRNIYEYLMRDKPINENTNLEHFLKMNTPIKTICEIFQENKPPIYDLVNPTIWNIGEKEIFDADYSEIKARFMQRIEENYNEMANSEWGKNVYNDLYMLCDYLKNHIGKASEADVKILMQFENPLKLIKEMPVRDNNCGDKIASAARFVQWSDVLTLPYELDSENVIRESVYRHDAITDLISIVPKHDFNTTMQWIDFYRNLDNESDAAAETNNPYERFIDAMREIADNNSEQTLQELYCMSWEHQLLENELVEAAKYLDNGGNIEKVAKLAKYGYFDTPYEPENSMDDDEFLEQFKQGDITMG